MTDLRRLRKRAYSAVHSAIRKGKLERSPCVICQDPITEAHHPYGYSDNNRLRVIFACHKHHRIMDIIGRIDRARELIGLKENLVRPLDF